MLKNYLTIALRTLQRQKLYSGINVLSLSLGIACCTLVLLYARHEWTADRFHEQVDNLYRVYRVEHRVNGGTKLSAGVSAPLGPALLNDLPNIEHAIRMRPGQAQVQRDDDVFIEDVLYAEPGFFSMFSFPLVHARSADPLQDPQSVVLSTAMATKYFGEADPVGQLLRLRLGDTFEAFTVAGVAAPFPNNSSITFDVLLPFTKWPAYAERDNWRSFSSAVYLQVAEGTDITALQAQLDQLVPQYYGAMIEENQAQGWWVRGEDAFDLQLQPMRDVHFSSGYTNMVATTSDPRNIYLLMGIGVVVLLLACVNFMTLAAGRATTRAREVGVRKTLGAHRGQLARQFWGEALLLSGLALVLGLLLADGLLPVFNNLAGTNLGLENIDLVFGLSLTALTLLCGLVAGSYPALILSGFRPADVLKGEVRMTRGLSFSKALVVFQFAISIGMVACTLIMFQQIEYVKTKDLGFADEEIVAINLNANQTTEEHVLDRFQQRARSRTDVVNVSSASYAFGDGWARTNMYQGDRQFVVYMTRVDPAYLETMGMALVAGRNFSEALTSDREQAVLINETLAKELRWDNPVGQLLPGYEEENVRIVGVVADYHFQSLREEIQPVLLHMSPSLGQVHYALLRLSTDNLPRTLAALRTTWQDVAPGQPFIYEFMDQRLDALYQAEERWSQIVQTAALFAILIACLGLFGLATLNVGRRTKEIGVRKVLGASVPGLALLLAKDFARLVLIAFVAACPLAYLVMHRWLDSFAYHTSLGVGVFALAGGLALVVAVLTVSYQAIRAAMSDPVKSLRYE